MKRDTQSSKRDKGEAQRDTAGVTPRARALLRRDVTLSRRDTGRDTRRDSDSPAPGRPVTITAAERFAGWLAGATAEQVEAWNRRGGK